jgi:hypothetical protein
MARFPDRLMHGTLGWMSRDSSRLLLAFNTDLREKPDLQRRLAALSLMLEDQAEKSRPTPAPSVNHTDRSLWVRSVGGGPISDDQLPTVEKAFEKELDWIGPVYRLPNLAGRSALLCPLPNVLLAKPLGQSHDGTHRTGALVAAAAAAGQQALSEDAERSKLLAPWHYLRINDPKATPAYALRDQLLKELGDAAVDLRFETMPLMSPVAVVPNDPLFAQQWDMTRIQAPQAWDINDGANGVVVCVLDEGCDRAHPDLQFTAAGINSGTMMGDGSPFGNHGTACAGIVGGRFDNGAGVSGVAGRCTIMPVAVGGWTDVAVAAGINYARMNGAAVISMSFGWNAWDPAIIDPAIQNAFNDGLVMCVATHNQNGAITYPATNALVMACGATDQLDNRKTPASPDGEAWGSNFGPQVSVVAPGVLIPTTDRTDADGYVAGDYRMDFNGTSSATPHVAGLAALVRGQYPALTNVEVRGIIERSAEKVGAVAYADTPGHPNGSWNEEMGYGRINANRSLDLADLMIRDAPADSGGEPGPGGNFWDFSDIVVRIFDDNVFVPADPAQSKHLELGQTNYLYVRVINRGPRDARNVVVGARLTPFVGTQFVYPHDWNAVDATHLSPTAINATFAAIPAGGEQIARFSISAAQVQVLWDEGWHPCLVASVTADNDYAFATAPLVASPIVVQRNNLAQRNLSVINVLAGASASLPFIAGHELNLERAMTLVIDRRGLPKAARVRLALDEGNVHFPHVDLTPPLPRPGQGGDGCGGGLVFLERTRVKTRLGCCDGVLTIEKGSSFDCLPETRIGEVSVKGGVVVLDGGARYVDVSADKAEVRMVKQPGQRYAFSVQVLMPGNARGGDGHGLSVAQRNEAGQTVGGASAWMVVAGG